MQVPETLQRIALQLESLSESAALDAQVLLAHVMGVSRAWVLAHPEAEISHRQRQALQSAVERLQGGEALPYVIGHWEFFGLDFALSRDVLIPRPETELLVEQGLTWLRTHPGRRWAADVGTGSGCIAISLAALIPALHVLATDLSPAALKVAQFNASKHAVADRIHFFCADLLDIQLPAHSDQPSAFRPPARFQPIDLIAANLPYIPSERLENLEVARREPRLALDGGVDGLDLVRRLLRQAPGMLAPGGMLLMEIDAAYGETARGLAQATFPEAEIGVLRDLAGLDRLVVVELPDHNH
jgi:release factor glutamine methyltransferase